MGRAGLTLSNNHEEYLETVPTEKKALTFFFFSLSLSLSHVLSLSLSPFLSLSLSLFPYPAEIR